ncbi:hypothetical protein QTO30_11150 [Yoonia sp. GPGPB17]|uniref:hypothetical protein n=1 Tax=Yoonia sp. GPGPB17 TaxID=3026147 RepID=UPI0030C3A1FB
MQFLNTQIKAGIWRGDLIGAGDAQPDLRITHLGTTLDQVTYARDTTNGAWRITVPIPPALLSDGVQTFVIGDAGGTTLSSFAIVCGEPLADDLRAEISLLRSELEVLKKAFRKHATET